MNAGKDMYWTRGSRRKGFINENQEFYSSYSGCADGVFVAGANKYANEWFGGSADYGGCAGCRI